MAKPVRPTPIGKYLHAQTELRISEEAKTYLVEVFTAILDHIAPVALAQASGASRTTLMLVDAQAGYASFLEEAGPSLLEPETLHTALDTIENDDFMELIALLQAELED